MDVVPPDEEQRYGQSAGQTLIEEGTVVESDMPPAEYKQPHGEPEADLSESVGRTYAAVLTAHFPDAASADSALAQLAHLSLTGHDPIQRFVKEAPEAPGDENDAGLAPGEVAIIVQLADEGQGAEGVRICQEAGAKHARFYPAQHIGDPNEA